MDKKDKEHYESLTNGGQFQINLDQTEACVALYIHDHGIDHLQNSEKQVLYSIIGKLKDKIWP